MYNLFLLLLCVDEEGDMFIYNNPLSLASMHKLLSCDLMV